jgi:hypothetical protein
MPLLASLRQRLRLRGRRRDRPGPLDAVVGISTRHTIGPSGSTLTIDAKNGIDDGRQDFRPRAQPRRTVAWISPCGSVVET